MTLPQQYLAAMSSTYMPVITAQIESGSSQAYYIDNNALVSTAWTTDCTLSGSLETTSVTACSAAPVLATDALDTTSLIGGQAYNQTAAGYATQGNLYTASAINIATASSGNTAGTSDLNAANGVSSDTWLSNQNAQAGSIGFAQGGWLATQNNLWSIEIGPVTENQVQLYIGEGDYSSIFTGDASNSVTLTSVDGTYDLSGAWFGENSSGTYYQELGYSQSPSVATIALNFQGIGLPQYEWVQLINLMAKTNQKVATELSCNSTICTLPGSCGTSSYQTLFQRQIMLQFGAGTNYVSISLESLVVTNQMTNFCDIYIQQTDQVILGSMWLQNFVAYFNASTLSLTVSATATNALISGVAPTNTIVTPFSYVDLPLTFDVAISGESGLQATIQADLGLQGSQSFLFSFTSNVVQTYSTNCTTVGTGNSSCAAKPNYATNYWDMSEGQALAGLTINVVDGYSTQGNSYNQTMCFAPSPMPLCGVFCTQGNAPFFVADRIVSNDWNFMSTSFAGVIGLGSSSPMWPLVDPDYTTKAYYYEVVLTTTSGSIKMGTGSASVAGANITIPPLSTTSQLYQLTEFGFGVVNFTDSVASYMSIINGDEALYGSFTNTTAITADFRGIGLPTTSFSKFVNLLSVATNGSASCAKTQGGFCVLPGQCSNYDYLTNYSFYISLAGDSNYMILPLFSVVATVTTGAQTTCNIYVESLDESLSNSQQIVLGVGFLQSFAFMQANSNVTTLSVNPNAEYAPYLGSQVLTMNATCIFTIKPVVATVLSANNFMPPLVETSINAPSGEINFNYFMLDFSNDQTVVWSSDCTQALASYTGACSAEPTYLNQNYTSNATILRTFTDQSFGGFVTSGSVQFAEINPCLYDSNTCASTITDVFVADIVSQDAWMYDQPVNAVGTLGYGLESEFWYQFTDPMTNTATYSVALGNNGSPSNITFGAGNTVGFETATPLSLSAVVASNATYALEQVGFGLVYQTDGVDTSSYFANFTSPPSALFTLNFIGMGLPQALWAQFTPLLQNITNNQSSCDGICTLPGSCSQYNLGAYSFQMMFSGSATYMNVPLSAFQVDNSDTCDIYVQELLPNKTQSSNIILGSMFFRNFYGIWTNTYNVTGVSVQVAQTLDLYVNVFNTSAYIGNEMLPTGPNPFIVVPPPTSFTLQVDIDSETMTASVQASLGSGSATKFLVSFTSNQVQTYTTNCFSTSGSSCTAYPDYTTSYFDLSNQTTTPIVNEYYGTYDGYSTVSALFNDSICIATLASTICNQTLVYAVYEITKNSWNYASPATAGIIGFNSMTNPYFLPNSDSYYALVQFQNVTDWSFVNASAPILAGNSITFSLNSTVPQTSQQQIVTSLNQNNVYQLTSFTFGVANLSAGTISAQSIINSDPELYGNYTNTTVITPDFRGIGLPYRSFNLFANLLAIATNGQATCLKTLGGMCSVPSTCANLTDIWAYSFQIGFAVGSADFDYLNVPLASFASDQMENNEPVCVFYVENLFSSTQQIVLGQMFFQSVTAEFTFGASFSEMILQVNANALPGTVFTKALVPTDIDAFAIVPTSLPVGADTTFPSVTVQVKNAGETVNGYYMLDFSNDKTVVWSSLCMQNLTGTNLSCSEEPVNVAPMYSSDNPAFYNYYDVPFGGYLTSGQIHYNNVCLNSACRTMEVYDAFFISEDNWLSSQGGNQLLSYGIIGMGPNSPLWNQYIDPTTGSAQYSLSLNKTDVSQSTITLGSSGLSASSDSMSVSTTSSAAAYALTTFGFGTVYQTDGVATSSYFSNMTTAPVQFSVNYQGLGLPQATYTEWSVLLTNLTQQSCTILNGACMLPGSCSTYQKAMNFTFQMLFTGADNYIQVPVSAFAIENVDCYLFVNSLSSSEVQSTNIILGYMFFQEFNAQFNNFYNAITGAMTSQTGTVTAQPTAASSAYIGNQMLAMGVNPFYTAPPVPPEPTRTPSAGAIVLLIIVTGLLFVLVGYNVYKYCCSKKTDNEQAAKLVYDRNSERQPMNIAVSLNKYDDEMN